MYIELLLSKWKPRPNESVFWWNISYESLKSFPFQFLSAFIVDQQLYSGSKVVEREKRDRETETDRKRKRERDRERQRETERQTERQTETVRQRDRKRHRQRQRETDRDRETERDDVLPKLKSLGHSGKWFELRVPHWHLLFFTFKKQG